MSDTVSLCWLGIHNWSKWKEISNASCHMFQIRECASCGKKKYKALNLTRHDWSQWEDQGVTRVMGPEDKEIPIRRELVQIRVCKGCGVRESRRILV